MISWRSVATSSADPMPESSFDEFVYRLGNLPMDLFHLERIRVGMREVDALRQRFVNLGLRTFALLFVDLGRRTRVAVAARGLGAALLLGKTAVAQRRPHGRRKFVLNDGLKLRRVVTRASNALRSAVALWGQVGYERKTERALDVGVASSARGSRCTLTMAI